MEIRRLTGNIYEESLPVWAQGFEKGDRVHAKWRKLAEKQSERWQMYGAYDRAGLQATVWLLDSAFHFGPEQTLPTSIIFGLACLPAARGKGYSSQALTQAFGIMREQGHSLSVLDCFSWEFYQGLGYDWVGLKRRYVVPPSLLPSSEETAWVRAADTSDDAVIQSVYRQFAGNYRGLMARTEQEWNDLLSDGETEFLYKYVYERDGQVEGYLTHWGVVERETRVREFVCLTPRAQRGLLGLLRRYAMQVKTFAWHAPADDGLYFRFLHNDITNTLRPCTMGRIVDVAGALQAWKPRHALNGSVCVAVQDAQCPWNAQTWHVTHEAGQTTATPTNKEPHVAIHVRHLAQAFWGTPSLAELRAAGHVQVSDEAGYETLRGLLDGPPMYLNDSF